VSAALAVATNVANITIAGAAAAALYLAWRQIGISRELSALEAYENYHMMCLQYPQFSNGNVDFEGFDKIELSQYTVYVLYTLMMVERIHALFPNDEGWRFSICDDIRMHKKFIASEVFSRHLANQQWAILPLIMTVLREDACEE